MKIPYREKHYCILIDLVTNAVLTVSETSNAILFLAECIPNTQARFSVNFPNYSNSFFGTFFFMDIDPENYINWIWDDKTRKLVKIKAENINDDLKAKSRLAKSKQRIVEDVINHLSFSRRENTPTVYLQEFIYVDKRTQALEFKNSGYNENALMKYPYVEQYANLEKITPKQAADDIIFKAEMRSQFLVSTELLRLRYFNLIKKAATTEELKSIFDEFMLDIYYNPIRA